MEKEINPGRFSARYSGLAIYGICAAANRTFCCEFLYWSYLRDSPTICTNGGRTFQPGEKIGQYRYGHVRVADRHIIIALFQRYSRRVVGLADDVRNRGGDDAISLVVGLSVFAGTTT